MINKNTNIARRLSNDKLIEQYYNDSLNLNLLFIYFTNLCLLFLDHYELETFKCFM